MGPSGDVHFSVVIPTRNRADTLMHCLRTVVSQRYDNLEIVISDNFSEDDTRSVADSFGDSRIRYCKTSSALNMAHSWEFALRQARGDWVMILGDDDGLLPGALTRLSAIIQNAGVDAVSSRFCRYVWPSLSGTSKLQVALGSGWEIRDARHWLKRVLAGLAPYSELPWIYTGGVVRRALLERARHSEGAFFRAMSPDIYSSVALALVTDRYVFMNEPFAMQGTSIHSNGAACIGNSPNRKTVDEFFSEANLAFYPGLGTGRIKVLSWHVFESRMQAQHLTREPPPPLIDQLAIALTFAERKRDHDAERYCLEIASTAQISVSAIHSAARRWRTRLRILGAPGWARTHYLTREADSETSSINNVYDATLAVALLRSVNAVHRHWLGLKSVFAALCRRVL